MAAETLSVEGLNSDEFLPAVSELFIRCRLYTDTLIKCGECATACREVEVVIKRWGWTMERYNEDEGPGILVRSWMKVRN